MYNKNRLPGNSIWPITGFSNREQPIAATKAVYDQLCVVADLLRIMIQNSEK